MVIPNEELLQLYIRKYGKKNVANVWSILNKCENFIDAFKTEIGQELYNDLIAKIAESKRSYDYNVLNMKDIEKMDMQTARHLIRYQAYMDLLNEWNQKFKKHKELSLGQ